MPKNKNFGKVFIQSIQKQFNFAKLKRYLLFGILNLLYVNLTNAQKLITSNSPATIRTQILEGETQKPVSFANVVSLKTQKGTICTFDGYFELPLDITDTLVVSAIGFEKEYFLVNKIAKPDGSYNPIRLMTKTYHIATVNIYELRWQKFKDEFVAVEMPKWAGNKYYWLESILTPEQLKEIRTMPRPTSGIPISTFDTYYQKQLAKIAHLDARAKIEKKIDEKYNSELVEKQTGLSGEELVDFMVYCNFNEFYLLNAETSDIIWRIKIMFKQFEKDKKAGILPNYHPIKRTF